jgi:hypothetical protein
MFLQHFDVCLILTTILQCVLGAFELGLGDDQDLTSFVTVRETTRTAIVFSWLTTYIIQRPEIRAPKFDVTVYEPEKLAPGYWFIAPYAKLAQEYFPSRVLQPCQIGPSIYDGNGVSTPRV